MIMTTPDNQAVSLKHAVFVICGQRMMGEGVTLLVNTQPDMEVIGSANSHLEALSALQTFAPEIILLMTDITAINQPKFVERLKTVCRQAKVLAVEKDGHSLRAIMMAGASGCLLTSAPAQALFQAIRCLAVGGVYLDDELIGKLVPVIPSQQGRNRGSECKKLTSREEEVLRLVARGYKSREIAAQLEIGIKTVGTHYTRAKNRLNLHRRTAIIEYGIRQGWLDAVGNMEAEKSSSTGVKNLSVISTENPVWISRYHNDPVPAENAIWPPDNQKNRFVA